MNELDDAILGYRKTAVLYAAVALDLPDLLAAGDVQLDELAAAVDCAPRDLARLLRALAPLGVCGETAPGVYGIGELGRLLLRDSETSHRDLVQLSVEQYWSAWSDIAGSLRDGKPAFEREHGMGPFAWRAANPDAGLVFARWLGAETERVAPEIAAGLDLGQATGVIADIAGGTGTLLRELLTRNERTSGILLDLPAVLEQAEAEWPDALRGRTTFTAGDLFGELRVQADTLVLKSVLHDWSDEEAVSVLRTCAATMTDATRLLVIERLLDGPEGDADSATWVDLHMLVVTGGRERASAEYADLLDSAGLRHVSVTATGAGFGVIEARRR